MPTATHSFHCSQSEKHVTRGHGIPDTESVFNTTTASNSVDTSSSTTAATGGDSAIAGRDVTQAAVYATTAEKDDNTDSNSLFACSMTPNNELKSLLLLLF